MRFSQELSFRVLFLFNELQARSYMRCCNYSGGGSVDSTGGFGFENDLRKTHRSCPATGIVESDSDATLTPGAALWEDVTYG